MIPSLPIKHCSQTHSCWLAARRSQARTHSVNSQAAVPVITPRNLQHAHLHQLAHPQCATKASLTMPRSRLAGPAPVPKSP
jgi:hypothetical protein